MSRIGKKPIDLPEGVRLNSVGGKVTVEGKLGKLEYEINPRISVAVADNKVTVTRSSESKYYRALHGSVRANINNMIIGVSKGYQKELEISGTGYRAKIEGDSISLAVGYSKEKKVKIPAGLKVTVDENTKIKITGIDKQSVGQLASVIRVVRPPDVYKLKGIKYKGEIIKKKAGKAGAVK